MSKISREAVLEATIKGLNRAQKQYLKWTDDKEGVSNGAEYVLTTYIAESVGNEENIGTLYVEEKIATLYEAVYETAEKHASKECNIDVRENGKVDIAIYLKNGQPLAIIEAKNQVRFNKKVEIDTKRIRCLLQDGVIEYGIIAFVSEFEEKDIDIEYVKQETKNLITSCRKDGDDLQYQYLTNMFHPTKSFGDNMWAWSSIAILFSKK